MKTTRKLVTLLGVAVLGISIAAVPAISKPTRTEQVRKAAKKKAATKKKTAAKKKKARKRRVSQKIAYQQAMQPPGYWQKHRPRKLDVFNRIKMTRFYGKDKDGDAYCDFDVTAFSTLGTDRIEARYILKYRWVGATYRTVIPKRVGVVWTPRGRAIKWKFRAVRAYTPSVPKNFTDMFIGFGIVYYRDEKIVDGKQVPAEKFGNHLPTIFQTYRNALKSWPKLTKTMGE